MIPFCQNVLLNLYCLYDYKRFRNTCHIADLVIIIMEEIHGSEVSLSESAVLQS